MFTNRHRLRIRWGDCDPAGIVFYPRYFEYFNDCTELLFDAALGMKKRDWFQKYSVIGIPVVELRARFLIPSAFGDEVTIDSAVVMVGRSSVHIRHALTRAGELAVEGFDTRVWAGRGARLRALPIPREAADQLRCEAGRIGTNTR
jgi:4-hydroxybenzoyl-CoA thioesterase